MYLATSELEDSPHDDHLLPEDQRSSGLNEPSFYNKLQSRASGDSPREDHCLQSVGYEYFLISWVLHMDRTEKLDLCETDYFGAIVKYREQYDDASCRGILMTWTIENF